MGDEPDEEPEPTLEEKIDVLLARHDELARKLKEPSLDGEMKRLIKVVLYLVILTLVVYVVKSLLIPIISYV